MTYLDPGAIGDVEDLDPLDIDWGNAIRDRVVHHFANVAARDAALTSPTEGMAAYINDIDALTVYNGVAWRPPWNLPWGAVGVATATAVQGSITTVVDLTSLTTTFTAIAGRRYRVTFSVPARNSSADNRNIVLLTDGSNNQLDFAGLVMGQANQTETMIGSTYLDGLSGSTTLKLRGQAVAGTMTVQAATGAAASLVVEDIGPSAAPS